MLEIKAESTFALADDILLREVEGTQQRYAFNLENGDHFSLNESAYLVLELIGLGVVFGELVQKFASTCGIESTQAAEDLIEVIAFAVDNNLVKEVAK